jgi:hypothetical protein
MARTIAGHRRVDEDDVGPPAGDARDEVRGADRADDAQLGLPIEQPAYALAIEPDVGDDDDADVRRVPATVPRARSPLPPAERSAQLRGRERHIAARARAERQVSTKVATAPAGSS